MDLIKKIKANNNLKASNNLANVKHHDLVVSNMQVQEVILKSFSSLVDYLEKRVSKTMVVNQLREIGTPDALKVVDSINTLHETIKTHENTDLSEITAVMRALLQESKQIPKELPKIPEQKFVDYTKQLASLGKAVVSVEKVIKAQKFVVEAPIVNVPQPKVNVEAPNLTPLQSSIKDVVNAVKAVVIPEYKTDNKEVEKLLKKSNRLLEELLDKPTGGGGGGGRATPYETPDGVPKFVTVNKDGAIPTTEISYAVRIDDTTTANTTYIGKASIGSGTSLAAWQIQRLDESTGLVKMWAGGNASFDKVWDNRASLAYQ